MTRVWAYGGPTENANGEKKVETKMDSLGISHTQKKKKIESVYDNNGHIDSTYYFQHMEINRITTNQELMNSS